MLIQNAKIYIFEDGDFQELNVNSCDVTYVNASSRTKDKQSDYYTNIMIDELEINISRGESYSLDKCKLGDKFQFKFDDGAIKVTFYAFVSNKITTSADNNIYLSLGPSMDDPIQYAGHGGSGSGYEPDNETVGLNSDDELTVIDYISSTEAKNLVQGNVPFSLSDPSLSSILINGTKYKIETEIGGGRWGSITGDINDQDDLIEKFRDYATSEELGQEIINRQDEDQDLWDEVEKKSEVSASSTGTSTDVISYLIINGTEYKINGGETPTDVYWSTLPYSSSDDTLITQYLSTNYVDNNSDQTIAGFKTFTDSDGIKVSDPDGLNYIRYCSGTIHYKRLDVDDEFDYLLPTASGTFALQSDITKVQANPTSEATATLNKLKVGDTTYSVSGGGDATVYLVDAELNYQTGEITWHSESISEDVLAYYDEHGYFPTIKLHLVVKYQGQVVQETNCDSKDNMKVESEDGDYLMSRFIIDGITESSSEGDKLEVQQFIYEDYGAEGKVGEVVEFSTESFQASKYHDKKEVERLLEEKQDNLTAGDNITIVGNVISAQIGERAPTYVITAEYDEETEEWVITSDNYYSQIITFFNTNQYYPSIFLRIGQNDYSLNENIIKNPDESLRLATDTSDPSDLYLSSNKYVVTLANNVQRLEYWSKLISDYAIRAQFTDNDEVSVTQINNGVQEVVKTPRLQKKLTAGDNITIIEDVISATNQLKNMYIHYVYLEEVTEDLINNSSPELFIITDDPTPYTTMYRFFEDISASNKISYRGPLHLKFINQYGDLELGFAHVLFTNLEELEPGKGELVFDYQVGATPDDGIIKTTRRIGFNEDNARIIDTVVPLFPNIFYCDYQFEHCTTQQSKWYIPGQQKFIQVTAEPGYKLPANITHSDNLTTVWWTQSIGYLIFNGPSEDSWVKITAEPI